MKTLILLLAIFDLTPVNALEVQRIQTTIGTFDELIAGGTFYYTFPALVAFDAAGQHQGTLTG